MSDGGGGHVNFALMRDPRPSRAVVSKPPADDVTTRYHVFPEFPSKRTKSPFHTSHAGPILPPPPLDDEDLLTEILCRLPSHPSSFLRASLACKLWGRLVDSAAFRSRVRAHHRHAPVLGVYEKHARTLRFIPTLDGRDRIPPERFSLKVCADHSYTVDNWDVLGCRHGRVLVINRTRRELLVFNPISGDRRVVNFPHDFVDLRYTPNGAVVCEDEGLGHSSKFKVALVGMFGNGGDGKVATRVYSSETGVWGDLVSTLQGQEPCRVGCLPCTLVGNGLYWWLAEPLGSILHFNLGTQDLTIINKPPIADINIGCSRIIRGQDGDIGLAVLSYPTFKLYDRKVGSHDTVTWVPRKIVEMDKILGFPASMEDGVANIAGYAEDASAIVMWVQYRRMNYTYVVDLESMKYKEIEGDLWENSYHPFADFYTSGLSALQLPTPVDNNGGAALTEDGDASKPKVV